MGRHCNSQNKSHTANLLCASSILNSFHAGHPASYSTTIASDTALAWSRSLSIHLTYCRLVCSIDNVSCLFIGYPTNLRCLITEYGVCYRTTDETVQVVEVYRRLSNRGPYPTNQLVKRLLEKFGFAVFEGQWWSGSVFAGLSEEGKVPIDRVVTVDGSVGLVDEVGVVKDGYGKSFAPFTPGLASGSSMKEIYLARNIISEVEGLGHLLKLNVLD